MSTPSEENRISTYYANKEIFITGATGFMCQYIVYKLLKSTQVKKIYVLIRVRGQKTVEERFERFLKYKIFKDLDIEMIRQRLQPVKGNIVEANFNLEDDFHRYLIDNIEIVIHGAACIALTKSLRYILEMNTKSTMEMIKIVKSMKKLERFVYISSASVHSVMHQPNEILGEYVKESHFIDIPRIMESLDNRDDLYIESIESKLLHHYYLSYIVSKTMAECLVAQECNDDINTIIIRPSFIVSSIKEPSPGFYDSMETFTLVALAGASNAMATLVDLNHILAMVPNDYCGNSLIAITALNGETINKYTGERECCVYNIGTDIKRSPTLGMMVKVYNEYKKDKPPTSINIRPWNYEPFRSDYWVINWFYELFFFNIYIFIIYHFLSIFYSDEMKKIPFNISQILKSINEIRYLMNNFPKKGLKYESKKIKKLWFKMNRIERKEFACDIFNYDLHQQVYTTLDFTRDEFLKIDTKYHEKEKYWKLFYYIYTMVVFGITFIIFPYGFFNLVITIINKCWYPIIG